MKITIISQFVDFPFEKGNDRFCYIAKMLCDNDCEVELITSDFLHTQKIHREKYRKLLEQLPYKVILLHEPGYCKNISFKRFYSHFIFGKNLKKFLNESCKADIIYCASPSIDVAYETAYYCNKKQIKFFIDIQDLWPEAFQMVFNVPVLSNIILEPMRNKINAAYAQADQIIAVSQTYVDRGMSVNKKCQKGLSVFLGTDLEEFDKYKASQMMDKSMDEIWIAYIGTLGFSYNLTSVIDAIASINNKKIRFIVMGNGPMKDKFEDYAKYKKISATFTGRLKYPEMVSLLCQCDIAVNPIIGNAASIINKVGDYAAAGLPVINTQECIEYRQLLEKYECGYNCENKDWKDLAQKLQILINSENIRLKMGINSRTLAVELFDRKKSYPKICACIEKMLNSLQPLEE